MDFTKLNDADFEALRRGDLSSMSDAGFGELVKQQQAAKSLPEKIAQAQDISREANDPAKDMSTLDAARAGAGKFIYDIGRGVAQRTGNMTTEQVAETRRLDAPLMRRPAAQAGNFGMALGTSVGASMLPGGQSIIGSGVYGGLQGLLEPTVEGESAGRNAALAGGLGMLGTATGNALSRLADPQASQAAQNLYSRGVPMTIGQRLGGAFNRAEEGLTSVPFMGDMIKNARRRAVEGFNSSVADEALAPIGKKLPAGMAGHDAVMFTERAIGDAYDNLLSKVGNVGRDSTFQTDIAMLRRMVRDSTMPKDVQAQFEKAIKSQIDGKFKGQGVMTADTYKQAEGELGRLAAKYGADASVDKQLLGDALLEAQSSLRGLLERSAGPGLADEARSANAAWAQFKRLQKASTFLGAEEGVFSPENYLNAVKALDRSKDKGAFARGTAMGQGLAQDAVKVLGRKTPDSGTPFRSLVSNPIQGGLAAALSVPLVPLYKGRSADMLRQLASAPRPPAVQWTAKQLEDLAPLFGALGVAEQTAGSSQ